MTYDDRFDLGFEDLPSFMRERDRPVDPPGTVRKSWHVENPSVVMRLDGLYDVVAFAPYRRVIEGVSPDEARAVAGGYWVSPDEAVRLWGTVAKSPELANIARRTR